MTAPLPGKGPPPGGVIELGAGYGRLAWVFLLAFPDARYVLVDIPPALAVSERYLSELFPDRRIFRFRHFDEGPEVEEELAAAQIAFLTPNQLDLITPLDAGLFVTISSLHEMRPEQVEYYLRQVARHCKGYFYFKQWQRSVNQVDKVVIRREDYPIPLDWEPIFDRPHPVQTAFFEAMYRLPGKPRTNRSRDAAGPTATVPKLPSVEREKMTERSNAIEIRGLHKSYRVPTHRVETFKERVTHPFRSVEYTEFRALRDISFDITAGEFFGIAGRNGSGKTTLLKLLASIYGPDRGTIRMAGRAAPFIELGVGFNPELAARDNVVLNGVMMGLTAKQAQARFERVIEFAELEDFVEMKLKNYSSGMRVRLGFAMLVEADADILLIDEVLAVGDAAFQQKCTDTFFKFKQQGRTIVLVTHAMEKLREYCDRAVLLHEGRVESIGAPDEVGDSYLELNFGGDGTRATDASRPQLQKAVHRGPARIESFEFEDESGRPASSFKHGEPIHFSAEIVVLEEIDSLCVGLVIRNHDGIWVYHLRSPDLPESRRPLEPGERLRVRGSIENLLASGRYFAGVGLTPDRQSNHVVDERETGGEFLVYGAEGPGGYPGLCVPEHEFEFERQQAAPESRSKASSAGS
jgi:ABC-2 type transport system ATP-binding protein